MSLLVLVLGSSIGDQSLTLNLTVIADIMTGLISSWQHPAIVELNPNMTLPNTPIIVVVPSTPCEVTRQVSPRIYILAKMGLTWIIERGCPVPRGGYAPSYMWMRDGDEYGE